jgi:hypothetical protein
MAAMVKGSTRSRFDQETSTVQSRSLVRWFAIYDFEGVAEGYYTDRDQFLRIMSQAEMTEAALEDEKRFIDHSRSPASLTVPSTPSWTKIS